MFVYYDATITCVLCRDSGLDYYQYSILYKHTDVRYLRRLSRPI